jgi:hypothetical protein
MTAGPWGSLHYREVCEYGRTHAECRCPDPNKHEKRVECDRPEEHRPTNEATT